MPKPGSLMGIKEPCVDGYGRGALSGSTRRSEATPIITISSSSLGSRSFNLCCSLSTSRFGVMVRDALSPVRSVLFGTATQNLRGRDSRDHTHHTAGMPVVLPVTFEAASASRRRIML